MATSPIFGWEEPDDTDLVKDGAAAIRTLGNAIDTTMGTMVPKSIVDAKGDLILGTAADTVSRLAVGTNGYSLVADSTAATGVKWAAPSGGKIVQLVYGSTLTTASTSSNSFVDSNLTATITPTSASNSILVMVSQNGGYADATTYYQTGLIISLFRSTTNLGYLTSGWNYDGNYHLDRGASFSISYLDSPATTSATTYKTQFRNRYPSASVAVQEGGETSTIVLMEIGA